MIRRLLGSATPWLLAGLIGLAVYSHMQAQRYAAERDAAVERTQRAEQRAELMRRGMEWQRDQIATLNAVVAEREATLDEIASDMRASRQALTTLERYDAPSRDWSSDPVPDGIRDWLRDLSRDRDPGGDADP